MIANAECIWHAINESPPSTAESNGYIWFPESLINGIAGRVGQSSFPVFIQQMTDTSPIVEDNLMVEKLFNERIVVSVGFKGFVRSMVLDSRVGSDKSV